MKFKLVVKFISFSLVLLFLLFSCDEDSTQVIEKQLDRPVKAVFFCVQEENGKLVHAQMSVCKTIENPKYYSVILGSNKGDLALVDIDSKVLVDMDPYIPGYNFVSVGFPALDMVFNDKTGEVLVLSSKNAKITKIHVNTMLNMVNGEANVEEIKVINLKTTEGNLQAIPGKLVLHEESDSLFVSVPRCGAVFQVTMDGTIIKGYESTDGTDYFNEISEIRCPHDGIAVENPIPDSGNSFSQVAPWALTIDGSDFYVGYKGFEGINSDLLIRTTIDSSGQVGSGTQVSVESGTMGWRTIKISPETRWGKFIYGVTFNGDVRVIRESDNVECDTNVDTKDISGLTIDLPNRGCFPNGSFARNFSSKNPGISLDKGKIFVDVTFHSIPEAVDGYDLTNKATFKGIYAVLVSMNGVFYIVNLDEDFSQDTFDFRYGPDTDGDVWPSEVLAHRFRNGVQISGISSSDGRIRMDTSRYYYVDSILYSPTLSDPDIITFDEENYLKDVEDYLCVGESWSLTYNGVIPDSFRFSGVVEPLTDSTQFKLIDNGGNFCSIGAKTGDVVTFTGCYDDNDCPGGYSCGRSPVQKMETNGMCFKSENLKESTNNCTQILASDREYKIAGVSNGDLILEINPLGNPLDASNLPLNCTENSECESLGSVQGGICGDYGYCVSAPYPEGSEFFWCLQGMVNYEIRVNNEFYLHSGYSDFISPLILAADGTSCESRDATQFNYRIPAESGEYETPFFTFNLNVPEKDIPWKYMIKFYINGGFYKYSIDASVRLPSWVGTGPDGNIYITDMGDSGVGGLTGQFLRYLPEYSRLDTDFAIR
jgi:hypothetical protein